MPLDESLEKFYIKTMPGMNNLLEDLDLQDKWVAKAQNCRFEPDPGSVDKRTPVSYFNSTTVGTAAINGLTRFYTSTGVTKFVIVTGTNCYVGSDSAGTFTAIRSSLTDGKRMSFETYKDLLICSNGYDNPFLYDGSSDNVTWELGACKSKVSSITAGSVEAGLHYYAVTIGSADEYVCGAISNTVSAGTAGTTTVSLSNIPFGPTGAAARKIYRTEAGGSNLKLLDTIADNVTTTYEDTKADATLGAAFPSVTDDIPVGSILKVHRERLFITGNPTYPSRIWYSNVYRPHYIQATTNLDYMDISPDDGDEIMGIPIQLGQMLCIKKNTIRKLNIASASSGADPKSWSAEDPHSWIGTPAQWSITQTPYGVVFLGWDHWYLYDGSQLKPIIPQFDIENILPSSYYDVVGFYHKGVMLAAYSDSSLAAQFHNRVMHYNFKRDALGIDLWTSDTLSGANCFASKSGDDESGELYYGDSQKGYVVKDRESEYVYKLTTKTECVSGTTSDTFVGGTENSPYIELGAIESASAIPDDVIIFWDNETTSPGTGWTEITSTYDGRFIYISSTSDTTSAGTAHTHSVSGTLSSVTPAAVDSGDQGSLYGLLSPHGHTFSGTSVSSTPLPRHVKLRVFKSDSCATTEFPDGAIVMYDQPSAPTGWETFSYTGYYLRIGSTGLASVVSSTHSHTFSITSSSDPSDNGNGSSGTLCAYRTHTHNVSGTLKTKSLDDWEVANVQFHFIKKVGEQDTWDGSDKNIYCCVTGTSNPTGWTAVSAYDSRYLKIGSPVSPTTQEAANASHTHTWDAFTSGSDNSPFFGNAYYRTQCRTHHTHPVPAGTSGAGSAGNPTYVSFRLFKFNIGKMKDYNDAISTSYTTGTWTSPSQQINAEALTKIYWNEDINDTDNDDITIATRTASSQTACEAAAWSAELTNPNGSIIASTAGDWIQYRISFTAADSTVTNPRVYFANSFVVKYSYEKGSVDAETSVNYQYGIGFRNFDTPLNDKFFKLVGTAHEGSNGSFILSWETENASDSFTVSLDSHPRHWESMFQDNALGKEVNFTITKNDLYDFRVSEIKGLYSPQPMII